jgi:hypothetical protein
MSQPFRLSVAEGGDDAAGTVAGGSARDRPEYHWALVLNTTSTQ